MAGMSEAAGPEPAGPAKGQGRGGKSVLGSDEIRRALTRIGHEILERTDGARDVVLLGIQTRGVPLARRLAARLAETEGVHIPVGALDITLYRDDLRLRPIRPDYVGKNLPTSKREAVKVLLTEIDGEDSVTLQVSRQASR